MSLSIPKTSGIYVIKNEKNGKIYVGSSINLRERWNQHRRTLKSNSHPNKYLQRAWNKYGEKNFKYRVLEICSRENLTIREQHWLDSLKPYDAAIGYNIAVDAEASGRGIKRSPEHSAKLSAALRGKKLSPEHIRKLSESHKGKKLSLETIEKMRQSNKGRAVAPQTIAASRAVSEKRYVITFPDGSELEIKGLTNFCRQNGLTPSGMVCVAQGKRKAHKGFKCRYVESSD